MSNGTAVSNDRVTLQVGERRYDVQTASDGEFSLTYRPVFLPVNTTTVPVQFIPEDTSLYLAAKHDDDSTDHRPDKHHDNGIEQQPHRAVRNSTASIWRRRDWR